MCRYMSSHNDLYVWLLRCFIKSLVLRFVSVICVLIDEKRRGGGGGGGTLITQTHATVQRLFWLLSGSHAPTPGYLVFNDCGTVVVYRWLSQSTFCLDVVAECCLWCCSYHDCCCTLIFCADCAVILCQVVLSRRWLLPLTPQVVSKPSWLTVTSLTLLCH